MRTALTQGQVSTIIAEWFKAQGSDTNYMMYFVDIDGAFTEVLVDHQHTIFSALPEEYEDG